MRSSQGGTASLVASFIQYCINRNIDFKLLGNYSGSDNSEIILKQIKTESNIVFTLKLLGYFLLNRPQKNDILYFHRPDHLIASAFLKRKKVIHIHGQPRTTIHNGRSIFKKLIYYPMELFAVKTADLLIFTDKRSADLYLKIYPFINKKYTIIPTGIDTSFFKPAICADTDSGKCNSEKVLMFIGRLEYPKRIDKVILSFSEAEKNHPGMKLVICGEGSQRKQLGKLVNDLGMVRKIIFTGEYEKNKLLSLIQISSAGILLSYNEGSPISVKEYLSCGIPVIVNDVGDVKDYIVPGRTGEVVDPDSKEGVANAIVDLLKKNTQMKQDCREMVLKYDGEWINEKIFKYIYTIFDK